MTRLAVGLLVTLVLGVILWWQVGIAYAIGFAALGVVVTLLSWRRGRRMESLDRPLRQRAGGQREVGGSEKYERVVCPACRGTGKKPLPGESVILAGKAKGSLTFVTPRCPVCRGAGWVHVSKAGDQRMTTGSSPLPRRGASAHC